ncbi:endonuclease NucS [Methanotorris igneus]|uniref:Endonuclease NucS n=1 Tax=Methanotorris igneus (strain DSM 5666 / JCM 11834 / Kol 5) TaxID=880724 RepID=F6BEG7_METIK|nr:endonuclease NucS [Methanotorris igneus]AEF95628.1 UPF0286 protein [Methanotorris igneus Kol 5]
MDCGGSIGKVNYLVNPKAEDIVELLASGIVNDSILVFFAFCRVRYDGRAKSELEPGDRIIIIKPDGSFLVHKNTKREPVNWQPPGSVVSWEVHDGKLVLKSVRKKPREILQVELIKVYHACSFQCEDYEELSLTGSEAEMAELIFENPSLIEDGFKPLFKEKQINHGIIDILGKDKSGRWVVIELKRRRADLQAVSQLKRYVECLKYEYGEGNIRGILVAPSLTSGAKKLLEEENLEFRELKPPKKERLKENKQTTLDFYGYANNLNNLSSFQIHRSDRKIKN